MPSARQPPRGWTRARRLETQRALAEAADRPLPDVLKQDYRVGMRFLNGTDPVEGMRVVLFDKEDRPQWSPAALADVTPHDVARHFADPGPPRSWTSGRGSGRRAELRIGIRYSWAT
ncbi:enoyl-CoA hydratase/isomerase family protein [Pseudonocardia sp. NPDC049154]|uniref:enoyl-CoA hydratase/isomerase family protein n=1 Tax=Pseudonocardia sp. NPDC049154 TaxID=3155501 RepID=UPI0033FBA4D8